MNRDSNSYTIIYASVMVVLVAIALAFTAISLKPKQQENERIDRMQQILRAINEPQPDDSKVVETYKKYILKELVVNINGDVLASFDGGKIGNNEAFDINTSQVFKKLKKDIASDNTKAISEVKLPVFIASVDNKYYYVLPMNGSGLWDAIWGYISVDASNHSTVFGADFGNKGETPGLGAEISTEVFAHRFQGKNFFRDGKFTSIAVVKAGHEVSDKDCVDGITGGTLTSNGVNDMVRNSISPYTKFLETYKLDK